MPEQTTPHQVIYCALGCIALLSRAPHENLRPLDQGIVAAVPDDVIRSLLRVEPQTPILFFSRTAYDGAIQGLSENDVAVALRARLARWSPRVLEHALERLANDERRALTLTAHSLRVAQGRPAQLLETHFDRGIELLASIAGTDRYDQMPLTELITAIVDGEALLLAELPPSPEALRRRQWAIELATELKRQGHPEYAQALPYAAPERGVWITPLDDAVRHYATSRGIAVVAWRGGAVMSLTLRAIEQFEAQGKHSTVLYFDPGALLEDVSQLSPPQLFHRFESLLASSALSRERAHEDYLNTLRLSVAVQRQVLSRRVVTDPPTARLLGEQRRAEHRILLEALAQGDSWLEPNDRAAPLTQLAVAQRDLVSDARFLADLARQRSAEHLSARLDTILQRALDDQARIAALSQ